MARPSKYNPKYHIPWADGLVMRGATVEEIAKEFGVAESTVYKWAKEDEEFSEALKRNRVFADLEVEKSLLKRAIGYTVTEKKTIVQSAPDGQQKPARIEITEKHIPADTTACIFWLKNREPNLWRDKREYVPDADSIEYEDALSKSLRELGESL